MAEGFLRWYGNAEFIAYSAGLAPEKKVHPLAVKVMEEIGIDISEQQPKGVGDFLGRESINIIITVCHKAEESCPRIWPGVTERNRLYWPFEDPAASMGSEEEKIAIFRSVRDQIRNSIKEWLDSRR
jgi:arsenate reductase